MTVIEGRFYFKRRISRATLKQMCFSVDGVKTSNSLTDRGEVAVQIFFSLKIKSMSRGYDSYLKLMKSGILDLFRFGVVGF